MLADYQQLVNDLVADQDTVITAEVRDRAIEEARLRYSADRPHHIVADVTWPALSVFGPVPEGWGPHRVCEALSTRWGGVLPSWFSSTHIGPPRAGAWNA